MYAVVSTGGKQYRVAKDDVIVVEKLKAEVGDTVTFDVLLVADGDDVTVGTAAASAVVTGEVVDHLRGEKLTVFKFKKRKGYKRTLGHRQELTKVRVAEVALGEEKPKRTRAAKPKAEATVEAPEAAKAEAAATETPVEEKPKPKRTAKPKAEATAETPAAAKADAAATETPAEEKPKRTRTAKPKAETEEGAE